MKTAAELKKNHRMGAGTMGPGIAQIFTMAGCEVCLYDISVEALEKAVTVLRTSVGNLCAGGAYQPE
jgi:3-hydroxyacyl-CoA dehydrogenase